MKGITEEEYETKLLCVSKEQILYITTLRKTKRLGVYFKIEAFILRQASPASAELISTLENM